MAKNIFNFGLGTVGGNKSPQNKLFRKQSTVISTVFVCEWLKSAQDLTAIKLDANSIQYLSRWQVKKLANIKPLTGLRYSLNHSHY